MVAGLSVVLVCSHPVALSVSIGLYHIVLGQGRTGLMVASLFLVLVCSHPVALSVSIGLYHIV